MDEKEYIERDKAIDACFDGWNNNAHDCAENIRLIPAADVRPVVRGRWISHDFVDMGKGRYTGSVECPVCGRFLPIRENFCPNCGAMMEES